MKQLFLILFLITGLSLFKKTECDTLGQKNQRQITLINNLTNPYPFLSDFHLNPYLYWYDNGYKFLGIYTRGSNYDYNSLMKGSQVVNVPEKANFFSLSGNLTNDSGLIKIIPGKSYTISIDSSKCQVSDQMGIPPSCIIKVE